MDGSSYADHFKAVTGTAPLRYPKSIRRHRDRLVMVHAGHLAGTAAAAVGYESPSRFGRGFERMMGGLGRHSAVLRLGAAGGNGEQQGTRGTLDGFIAN